MHKPRRRFADGGDSPKNNYSALLQGHSGQSEHTKLRAAGSVPTTTRKLPCLQGLAQHGGYMTKRKLVATEPLRDRPLKHAIEAAKPVVVRSKTLLGGAFVVKLPKRRRKLVEPGRPPYELAIVRPILRGFLDAMPTNDAMLRFHARIALEAHLGKGSVLEVAPDLRARLEALRPWPSLTLHPNWLPPVPGLNFEQCALVERYRRYAMRRADSFWWKRNHFLNHADRLDLRQVAWLELCLTARTLDLSLGLKFGTPIKKALAGAFFDWMRERYSVVHRSPEAWKKWIAERGKAVSWLDEGMEIPVRKDGGIVNWIPRDFPDRTEAAREIKSREDLAGALTTTGWQLAENCLTPRELEVFRARYVDNPGARPSQKELGARLGVRPDTISALEVSGRSKFAEAARLMLAEKWRK
jgi:hypothetical protein